MKKVKFNNGQMLEVGKIVCVGRNYAEHAKELGNDVPEFPLIFLKPASVMINSGERITHPDYSADLHHEVELVLSIGARIKDADESEAEAAINGYAVGLDMTLRDLQFQLKEKGHPWTLAKVFDGSAVISEFVSADAVSLSMEESISLSVNEEVRQSSKLNKMIFSPAQIVSFISMRMTLESGDLIYTGTPAGVGKVVRGDKISATIENVGHLTTEII